MRRFKVRTVLIGVAVLALLLTSLRHGYTSFDTSRRGWGCPGWYAEFDIGCCRLAYFNTSAHGRKVEFQPACAEPTVLWRW